MAFGVVAIQPALRAHTVDLAAASVTYCVATRVAVAFDFDGAVGELEVARRRRAALQTSHVLDVVAAHVAARGATEHVALITARDVTHARHAAAAVAVADGTGFDALGVGARRSVHRRRVDLRSRVGVGHRRDHRCRIHAGVGIDVRIDANIRPRRVGGAHDRLTIAGALVRHARRAAASEYDDEYRDESHDSCIGRPGRAL